MKKRVQARMPFMLLVILVTASLIIDLAFLNTLYALSPEAYDCIANECDSESDCIWIYNSEYEDCVRSHTVTDGYTSYILPSDITLCNENADSAYDVCMALSADCAGNCQDRFPETEPEPLTPPPEQYE